MNSLKTMTLVALMAAVAYGVYASLNKKPLTEPVEAQGWNEGVQVEMPTGLAVGPGPLPSPPPLPGTAGGPNVAAAGPDVPAPQPDTPASPAATQPAAAPNAPPPTTPPPVQMPAEMAATQPAESQPAAPPVGQAALLAQTQTSPSAPPGQASGISSAQPGQASSLPAQGNGTNSVLPGEGVAFAADTVAPPLGQEVRTASATPQDMVDVQTLYAQAMQKVQGHLGRNELAEALAEMSPWYDHPQLSPETQNQVTELLDRLAGTVIYSYQHHLLQPAYVVQTGDTLEKIAEEHQLSWQLLAKINGIEQPSQLRPGTSLKVVRGPFHAVVDLGRHRMTLFLQGNYAGRFPIGVGRELSLESLQAATVADDPTGAADFEVAAKIEKPQYESDVRFAPGDPQNPLGSHWIDLGRNIGIHGTNDPRNIGRDDSRGCICLSPEDVQHVYDMLVVGSKVAIRR